MRIVLFCSTAIILVALFVRDGQAQTAAIAPSKPTIGFELYSWKDSNGGWDFCLLPSPSGVSISAEAIFDKKCQLSGMEALFRKISGLPDTATIIIYWPDRITGHDPRKNVHPKLAYPPSTITEQVRKTAEARHIDMQILAD